METTVKLNYLSMFRTRIWERYYPLIAALIAAVGAWFFDVAIKEGSELLLSATITFGAIVSGFVGTSLSILTSLGTPVMHKVRKTSYIKDVRHHLGWGLGSGVILSCISIVGLLFGVDDFQRNSFTYIWTFGLVFCLACLYRLGMIMLRIFSDPENLP